MYHFHKANIVGQSLVYVVYYINDRPVVRLSMFSLITDTIIVNVQLSISISPVVIMRGKQGEEGSTKSDKSARHSGRRKRERQCEKEREEEMMTMVLTSKLNWGCGVLEGGIMWSCFWCNDSMAPGIMHILFVHSDGFVIKEFHFLLPSIEGGERE